MRRFTDLRKLMLEHRERDLLPNKSQWCSHFWRSTLPRKQLFFFLSEATSGQFSIQSFPDACPWCATDRNVNFPSMTDTWINPLNDSHTQRGDTLTHAGGSASVRRPQKKKKKKAYQWEVALIFPRESVFWIWVCVCFSQAHQGPRCQDRFFQPFIKKDKESHNKRTKINMHCVYVVSSIIHTAVFSFRGTKGTSQHNTAADQYTLSNPPHIPLAVLLLFSLLFLFSSFFSNFSSSSSSFSVLSLKVFASPLLLLFFNPCLFLSSFTSSYL